MERNIELRTDYLKADQEKLKTAVALLSDSSVIYGLEPPNENTIRRWLSKERIPVIGYLILIAKAYNTNIDFLLKRTNNNTPDDRYYSQLAKVEEARIAAGFSTRKIFCEKCAMNYTTVTAYEMSKIKYASNQTLGTLLMLSDKLGVSIDFILGLSDKKAWEMESPLSVLAAETPIGIKTGDISTTGLISADRKNVIFPNGKTLPITDSLFKNATIFVYEESYKLD